MKRAICIGNVSYDVTMMVPNYPEENTKNRIDKKVECGGGPAATAAYVLGKWGIDTTFVGSVGYDTHGKKIIDEFRNVQVNTDYITVDSDEETTLSFIVVNEQTGSRTTFAYRPRNLDCTLKKRIQADLILVDGQEKDVAIQVLKDNPKAISMIDAGRVTDSVLELAKMVQYLVCSKNFAEDYTGIKIDFNNSQSIIDVFNKLETDFKNTVVITLEAKGSLYKKDGTIKLMPSIQVKQVDSTGAGDIFHGAFAYCLLQGYDIEKAIKIANITGALSVTKIGTRNSVFPVDEVMKFYETI